MVMKLSLPCSPALFASVDAISCCHQVQICSGEEVLAVDDSAKENRMLRTALVLLGLIMGLQNVEM